VFVHRAKRGEEEVGEKLRGALGAGWVKNESGGSKVSHSMKFT